MKIQELIKQLQLLWESHGDLQVVIAPNGYDAYDPIECDGAELLPSEVIVRKPEETTDPGVYHSQAAIIISGDTMKEWNYTHPTVIKE